MAALLAVLAAGCSYSVVVTASPLDTGDGAVTEVPIGPTAWPQGTVGQYGVRVDPNLSASLPSYVGGNPLVEDPISETLDLDIKSYGEALDSIYVAQVGQVTDLNWVQATLALVKGSAVSPEFYTSWRDQWFKGTCAQADGIASTTQESIDGWSVDIATCAGGPRGYTVILNDGLVLSIVDLGPRQLGRQLIQALP